MEAPILYIIIFILLIIYCIKVFIEPIFLINSLRAIWFSLIETLKQLKSFRGVIAFILVYITLSGFILIPIASITNTPVLYHIATTLMVFWSLPLITPLIPLTILITMLITKYVLRDKNINMKLVLDRFVKEIKGH